MGKLLESIVEEWKKNGLGDDPFYQLLVDVATQYANDSNFDSSIARIITEAPLCTCLSIRDGQPVAPQPDQTNLIGLNYRGSHPLLHDEECSLHSGQTLIINNSGAN